MTMQPIVFKVALFRDAADQARSQLSLLWMMEALCRVNQSHIRHARGLEERGKGRKYPLLYRAGVHYEREKGTEEWLDIPHVLASASGRPEYPPGAWGDCLPLETKLFKMDGTFTTIGKVRVGDKIASGHGWTTVQAQAATGMKPILRFTLDSGLELHCSPSHRLFLSNLSATEIRAEKVAVGTQLKSGLRATQRVVAVAELPETSCADITTDTGRFWLPEADVVVHNCEDLACWRVSELRERPDKYGGPIKAKPFAKWKLRMNGSYGYHALVLLPNGQLEDPSLTLGMTYERQFQKDGMAQKFKDGVVKPKVRFAALPEVVVVDPERQGGYGVDPNAARATTGLFGAGDEPALAEGAAGPPPALGVAAFGYNRGEVNERDMQELLTLAKEI